MKIATLEELEIFLLFDVGSLKWGIQQIHITLVPEFYLFIKNAMTACGVFECTILKPNESGHSVGSKTSNGQCNQHMLHIL